MTGSGGGSDEGSHGGVARWLERNFDEHADRGRPVSRQQPEPADDWDRPRREDPAGTEDGNLVQLPAGAMFGTETRPSPRQREELARYAARVEDEMLHLQPPRPASVPPEDEEGS